MAERDKEISPEVYVDTDESRTAQVAVQGDYFNVELDPNTDLDTTQSRSVQGQVVYDQATNGLLLVDIHQTKVPQQDLESINVSDAKKIDVTAVVGLSPTNFFKKMRSTPGIDVEETYVQRGAERGFRMTKNVDDMERKNGGDPEAQVPKRGGFAMKRGS